MPRPDTPAPATPAPVHPACRPSCARGHAARPHRPALLLATTLAFGSLTTTGADAAWPNWRGPTHDGIAGQTLPEGRLQLEIAWRAEAGIGFSSFAISGDRVLTMGNVDDVDLVSCWRLHDGQLLWRHEYSCELDPLYYEGGPGATPTVHGEVVYTLSKKGHVHALRLEDGAVIWQRDLLADHGLELPEWSYAGSPAVDGDQLLLNIGTRGVALDLADGSTRWISGTDPSGYATPVKWQPGPDDQPPQWLMFGAQALHSVDRDGNPLWSIEWPSSRGVNAADPVVRGDQLLAASSSGAALLRWDPAAGAPVEQWRHRDLRSYFNPGVLLDGYLYAIHGTTHNPTEVICLRWDDGEVVWQEPGFGSGGLILAGDVLIICDRGELILVRATPEGYDELVREQVLGGKCWTAPALADGHILARNAAGDVVAVRVTTSP